MNRRKFIRNMALLGAGGMLTGVYTYSIEPEWLEIVHRKMLVAHLPASLSGARLIQISDIHIGNEVNKKYLADSFRKAQRLNPDFVVYTGDYISYETDQQLSQLQELVPYFPKGRYGTVGILGNHDYGEHWANQEVAAVVSTILKDAGIPILRNEQIHIKGLNIIGLDDYWAVNFKPESILPYHDPSAANIVLCHNPDACDLDIWNGYRGWILSGHTHGGQCKPPFLKAPVLPTKNKRYDQGEIDLFDGRILYINRALGHLNHIRFNVRPEITVFTLARK